MLTKRPTIQCLLVLLCLNWLAVTPTRATSERSLWPNSEDMALVIVVNKNNPVENISSNELRNLLLAEQRTWANGRRVTIVMRPPGQPERATVLKTICRMTDSDYTKYFMRAQFTGDLQASPKLLATAVGMRKFVFNVPGAIGYLRADEVDDSVKVIRLDNRLPSDPGYKLKVAATRPLG
jgi:ABC-type phosphate transport system substrate-binding protein